MREKAFVIIIHSNGKTKLYRTERYLLIKKLKFAGAIAVAIAVMLLLCGMAVADDGPAVPFQLVVLLGIGLFALIALIYSYVSDSNNKNVNRRNKK